MYEIIAHPKDFTIDSLAEKTGNGLINFEIEDRQKWAVEFDKYTDKLKNLVTKTGILKEMLMSEKVIKTTDRSLKAFKQQLFQMNEAAEISMKLADKIESEIINK